MSAHLAAAACAVAAAAGAGGALVHGSAPRRRVHHLLTHGGPGRSGPRAADDARAGSGPGARPELLVSTASRVGVGVAAGCAAALVLGGTAGPVVGLVLAVATPRLLGRLEPGARRRRRRRVAVDLPVAADLLAACLAAGAGPASAAAAVGASLGGPVGEALDRGAALVALGSDPGETWGRLADDRALAPLGRALARAADGGLPLAEVVAALADEVRAASRARADAAARRVGVRAVAPLGVCFLPAFVLVGVVPVVAGVATSLLGTVTW